MTLAGGFPAPGPEDRGPARDKPYAGPPPPGLAMPPQPTQPPMLTAFKPGIVPLRPLTFADILDGGFKAVRFNPKSMVGLSALVLAAFLVPSALLGIGATHLAASSPGRFSKDARSFFEALPGLLEFLSSSLATALLIGMLVHVVGQAVLGRKPDFGQTWRATRGRLPALVVLNVLLGLFVLLATAVLLTPGVLVLTSGDNNGAGLALLFFGGLVAVIVSAAAWTKVAFAGPAIVLEGHTLIAGLRRSWALTRGAAFWRVLGITFVAELLAIVVGWVLSLPLALISVVVIVLAGPTSESGQMIQTFISHLSTLLTGAITTPFVAAVTCLLYIDRRMRLEALDVVLLREAQTNPAPRI